MYEVLVYVYENYDGSADCADRQQLGRRLSTLGFERNAIQQALSWLDGLDSTASGLLVQLEDEALTVRATRAALAKLNAEPDRLVQ